MDVKRVVIADPYDKVLLVFVIQIEKLTSNNAYLLDQFHNSGHNWDSSVVNVTWNLKRKGDWGFTKRFMVEDQRYTSMGTQRQTNQLKNT